MSEEIPAWLGTIRQFDYRLPTPTNNLKSASTNEAPAYINIMRHGAVKVLEEPLNETIANLRNAELAQKKKIALRGKILSASRKLGVKPKPKAQLRSASTNTKPAWLATRDYFLYGA